MKREEGRLRSLKGAAMLSVVGIQLAVSTIVGAGIGYLLDRWLGTEPWLLVLFFVIGTIAGFREMIRTVSRASQDEEPDERL
jgi:ATP synthase protein I